MANEIFFNARAKALENKLITLNKFKDFAKSNDALATLREISEILQLKDISLNSVMDYEKLLGKMQSNFYDTIKDLTQNKDVIKYFLLPQDYYNVEILIKERYCKLNFDNLIDTNGNIETNVLIDCVRNKKYDNLPDCLKSVLMIIDEDKDLTFSGKQISAILKKSLYEELSKTANKSLKDVVSRQIDLINIETALRVKNQSDFELFCLNGGSLTDESKRALFNKDSKKIYENFKGTEFLSIIETSMENYEKNEPFVELEKEIDNFPIKYFEKYKYTISDINPVLQYYFYCMNQVKNIRIIMTGLINKLDKKEILNKLRMCYER